MYKEEIDLLKENNSLKYILFKIKGLFNKNNKPYYTTKDYGFMLFWILYHLDYTNIIVTHIYNLYRENDAEVSRIELEIRKKDYKKLSCCIKNYIKILCDCIEDIGIHRDINEGTDINIKYSYIPKRRDCVLKTLTDAEKEDITVLGDMVKTFFDKERNSVPISEMRSKERFGFLNKAHYDLIDMDIISIRNKNKFEKFTISIDYVRDPDEGSENKKKVKTGRGFSAPHMWWWVDSCCFTGDENKK